MSPELRQNLIAESRSWFCIGLADGIGIVDAEHRVADAADGTRWQYELLPDPASDYHKIFSERR